MKLKIKTQKKGFSLIEILTVIVILAVLGGISFGTFMLIQKGAKNEQAEVMLQNVSSNIETALLQRERIEDLKAANVQFSSQDGVELPDGNGDASSSHALYRLLSGDTNGNGEYDEGEGNPLFPEVSPKYEGNGKYAKEVGDVWVLVDPWQQPLRYEAPGQRNNAEGGFDLWSIGPDGNDSDEEDNLGNW